MKASELTGALLDFWVAKAVRSDVEIIDSRCVSLPMGWAWSPSTDWALAGPIIEHESIDLTSPSKDGGPDWHAAVGGWPQPIGAPHFGVISGPTPLIAAMRAYVASKFGEDIPENPALLADKKRNGIVTPPIAPSIGDKMPS